MATAYLITNTANGKQYVGFTKNAMRTRWTQHCCDSKVVRTGSALHAAIRKYGRDSFTIRALGRGNIADMLELERIKIAELGTVAPAGYNLNDGGTVCTKYTDATRARMSASAKARAAGEDRSKQLAEASRTRWARPGAKKRAGATRSAHRKPGKADRDRAIRIAYAQGGISQKALGEKYGLTQTMIWRILKNIG